MIWILLKKFDNAILNISIWYSLRLPVFYKDACTDKDTLERTHNHLFCTCVDNISSLQNMYVLMRIPFRDKHLWISFSLCTNKDTWTLERFFYSWSCHVNLLRGIHGNFLQSDSGKQYYLIQVDYRALCRGSFSTIFCSFTTGRGLEK